jgi:hypothetical protein
MRCPWVVLISTESKVGILTALLTLLDSLESLLHFALLMKVVETEFFPFFIFAYMRIKLVLAD